LFSSVQNVLAGLALAGYITDEITATIVYLAARLNKPILLEGPPGSGKTELAYAVAKATATEVERLQCFEGINEEKAIGKFDESLQRLAVDLRSKSGPVEWEPLKEELHGLRFFSAGPLLRALQYPKRCVLLIDELDKVSQAFEAQSFKRACSCFGLGRYLYYFAGIWVDLDQHRRPKNIPALPRWATPEGWRQGLRPAAKAQGATPSETPRAKTRPADDSVQNSRPIGDLELVRQIRAMAEPLGKRMYRGFLKALARVWDPRQIDDPAVLQKILTHMQSAQRGLTRLDAALDRIGPESMGPILDSLGLRSLDQVDNLDLLQKIVLAMETKAADGPRRT
jgi:DNA polymerase III delta prime subunit